MNTTTPSALQATFAKAVGAFNAGRLTEAERLCRSVLSARPNVFDARHLMALIQSGLGQDKQAIENFDRALALKPTPEVLNGKATSQQKLRRYDDALASYDRAIALNPRFAEAHYNRATTLEALGRQEEAVASYDRAIAARPDFVEAFNNRGNRLAALGRTDEALTSYDRALALRPDHVAVLHNRGRLLRTIGRHDAALTSYDRALARAPDSADIWNSRGVVLQDLGRSEQALASFDAALLRNPNDGGVMLNRAKTLLKLRRDAEALEALEGTRRAGVDEAELLALKGNALGELDRVGEALDDYDAALRLRPDDSAVLADRANVLRLLGRSEAAMADYDRAIALDPANEHAVYGRGTLALFMGRYAEGWRDLEKRRSVDSWPDRGLSTPEWDGGDIAGRTLLIHAEQGQGDTIQFCRFVGLAAERAGKVLLEVPPSLLDLASTLPGVTAFARGADIPAHDVHLPMMSLPFVLGVGDRLLPESVPYLKADPARVADWAERLPAKGSFRIGIAWQGNPNARVDRVRSVPLKAFAPLARLPGVTLISLQKHDGLDQLADLPAGMTVLSPAADYATGSGSFMEAAAIIENLDLVVSIDSAVTHLAGALGRPVIVALKQVPEWRWMAEGEGSHWYPSAQLFRQAHAGDWDELFGRIAEAVAARLNVTDR
ncbi:tetratricopeptide repeat protein [Kaistia dalseonensis]|uniref:Tetratricopeptide (TPR) repeat protein n=1 Tax=Kaistia dalseonensis TaxID=410840 RepID=A0ABU0H257_9HYPH|nr:tetratricopeptide repeat protein [Kaistia dalseonensis]MCX5493820.1 tetratricopeptide repeat protein [Kaistia dalseonensis]MDQ0436385.1 tetratricopeptide (TPR) repeat protein [Kaistia dalseonensis]